MVVRVRMLLVSAVLARAVLAVVVAGILAPVLMVPEHHALPRRNGGHPLYGDGQREQRDSEDSEETLWHRAGLYASRFEPRWRRMFRHPAHFRARTIAGFLLQPATIATRSASRSFRYSPATIAAG